MKVSEIRQFSLDELKKSLIDLLRERFSLRLQKQGGNFTKNHLFKINRIAIAQTKTVIAEKSRTGNTK